MTPSRREAPDRNLALELVRVTEAGAMAAGRWVGRGDKEGGDGAAVDAMRELVNSVSMRGVVVIGEGEKDHAPMLYNGEEVGNGDGPECDFAVDPVDGTTLMSKGMPNAISVLAVAERGAMFDPSAVFYMDKIAVGPDAADVIDITAPIGENIARVAKVRNATASRSHRVHPRPAPAPTADRRRPRGRRADPADHRRRCGGRDFGVPTQLGHRHARRHRRHTRGHHRRGGHPLHGRSHPGQAGADRRRGTPEGPRCAATTWIRCSPPRTWCPARTCSSAPPASPTATCCKGVQYYGGGCTTQSIVMRSKSGTVRMVEAYHRLVQAQRVLRGRLHRRQDRRTSAAVDNDEARDHHTWPTVPSTRKTRPSTASSTTPWARSACRSQRCGALRRSGRWRTSRSRDAASSAPRSGRSACSRVPARR